MPKKNARRATKRVDWQARALALEGQNATLRETIYNMRALIGQQHGAVVPITETELRVPPGELREAVLPDALRETPIGAAYQAATSALRLPHP